MSEKTYSRPPDAENATLTPDMIMGPDEELVKAHYRAYLTAKMKGDGAKINFNDKERFKVVAYHNALRKQGFYVVGIDDIGNLLYGRRLKSDIQMEIERNGDHYERRGNEVRESGFANLVKNVPDFDYQEQVNPDSGEVHA